MTVTRSTLVDPETAPSDNNDLWQPPVFFLHNWERGCEVETSWRTMVTQSRSNKEQRFSLMERPRRTIQARGLGWNNRERGQQLLRNNIARLGDARQPFPLYPDRVKITAKGPSFPKVYVTEEDLDLRRFQVGSRVLAANKDNDHPQYVDDFVITHITAIDAANNELTLNTDLGETYTGEITEIDSGFANHSTVGSPKITDANLANLEVGDHVVAFVCVTPVFNDVTSVDAVSWEAASPLSLTQRHTYTWQIDGGSGGYDGKIELWSGQVVSAGTGSIKVTFTTTKAGSVAVAAWGLRGVDNTSPIQASDADQDYAPPSFGIPPAINNLSLTRATEAGLDWCGVMQVVDRTNEAGRMVISLPAELVTQDYSVNSPANSVEAAGTVMTGNSSSPLAVKGQWNWLSGGATLVTISASILPDLSVLDTPPKRFLWPLLEANMSLDSEYDARTTDHTDADLTLEETAGSTALEPLRDPNTVNPSWPTHTEDSGFTFPIFDFFPDWQNTDIRFIRPGRANKIGTGLVFDVYGNRPLAEISSTFTGLHRSDVWDLMEFFDSRAGRTFPFWYVSPTADYEFVSNNGSTRLDVTAAGAEEDWNMHPFIAVVMKDGTYYIRRISSTTRVGSTDQITLSSSISTVLDANDVKKVSVAYLCRFATDSFKEEWITDEIQEVNLKIFELDYDLETTDKSLSLDDICPGGSGSGGWVPDGEDICDDRCCGTACNVCLDEFYSVILTCYCYAQSTGEDCEDPCDGLVTDSAQLTIVLQPVSCTSGVARWENGDAWVTLDLDGPTWNWDLGSYNCCAGLEVFTACLCVFIATDDCSPATSVTETCSSYLKETVTDITCALKPAIEIECGSCVSGAC